MSNNIFMSTVVNPNSNGNVINTTYNDLLNLITNNNLVVGAIYEFSYLLKFNMVGTAGEFTADNSEIIQVKAISINEISNDAYSVTYNENISYTIFDGVYGVATANSTGYIQSRYLNSANETFNERSYNVGFDFRNQYFYKYVTATNKTGFTNVDNATAFIKYFAIPSLAQLQNVNICFCQNIEFILIKNSTYKEFNNTAHNYRYLQAINSDVNVINEGFFDVSIDNSKIFSTELNNVHLVGVNFEIQNSVILNTSINSFYYGIVKNKSEINNSSFNNLQFINLDNSILETCTSTGNFTVNCVNSSVILAKDCYVLTYFDLNGAGLVFNNNNIVNNTSTIRYLKFSSGGTEFTYNVPVGFAVGVYDMFYLPSAFWTVDKQFVAIPDVPNPFLGAIFNIGNNGAFNNLLFNLSELTVIANNVNNNITVPIRINIGGLLKFEVLTANCNNAINFSYTLRTIS